MSKKSTVATVSLRYKGHTYTFPLNFPHSCPEERIRKMFYDGNFSCDCNRSLFIQSAGNPDFDELPCGHEIELIALEIVKK